MRQLTPLAIYLRVITITHLTLFYVCICLKLALPATGTPVVLP